jgi:hypothetical protein
MQASYDTPPWYFGTILIVGLIILGFIFFWIRSNYRRIYGLCEIVAAVVVFVLVIYPQTLKLTIIAPLPDVPPSLPRWLNIFYGILAGVYVFVRGMDNMFGSYPSAWPGTWRDLFANPVQWIRQRHQP